MRRTFPARGAAPAALLLLIGTCALVGAAGPKAAQKKKPTPASMTLKIDETVGTLATVRTGEVRVEGVGLVIGLDNTGSNPPPGAQRTRLLGEMRRVMEHPEKWLESPRCSMVVVRAVLPYGIGTKDPIDVDIELPSASGTTSLAGGHLLMTELAPVMMTANDGSKEGKVLAKAGGPIMTGTMAAPNNLKAGRVLGGGKVRNDIPFNLVVNDERRSARTTKLIEDIVKVRFHESDGVDQKGMATAKTDQLLILKVPKVYHHNQFRYFQVIQHLCVIDNPNLRAQRMQTWTKELLDPKTAGKAALRLEGIGSNSIPILKQGLASTDPQVKFFSAEALAYLGNVDGADALAETATKRADFRSHALKALAAMDQAAGLMRLRALMSQADVELRYGAFDALRSFDATDPFLGWVPLYDPEPTEDAEDSMALQTESAPRKRRKTVREEPFKLYVVDSEGPPLVHISRNLRSEVVIFGRGQKLLTPVVLGAGGAILVNAPSGDTQVQISRIAQDTLDEPDSRVSCSLEIPEVVRQAARIGATYPELVAILTGAFTQKNLPGPLVVDAVPLGTKAYSEAQLLGGSPKKDDAVKKTSAGDAKKPRMFDRIRKSLKR